MGLSKILNSEMFNKQKTIYVPSQKQEFNINIALYHVILLYLNLTNDSAKFKSTNLKSCFNKWIPLSVVSIIQQPRSMNNAEASNN